MASAAWCRKSMRTVTGGCADNTCVDTSMLSVLFSTRPSVASRATTSKVRSEASTLKGIESGTSAVVKYSTASGIDSPGARKKTNTMVVAGRSGGSVSLSICTLTPVGATWLASTVCMRDANSPADVGVPESVQPGNANATASGIGPLKRRAIACVDKEA